MLLLLPGLGMIDLWEPDEPRIAQVAEELRASEHGASGLVLLRLNGEPYTQKPPLYYWIAAALGAPGGRVAEVPARLPSALAGLALVVLVLVAGPRWVDPRGAVWGAALLLTVREFPHLARRAQFDVLLALFETAALVAFWRLDRGIGQRGRNLALMHGAMGLAVLTKGPVGLLIPLLVVAAYLLAERRLREIGRVLPLWGFALSAGPALLWLAGAVALAPAGFLGEAVGENVLGRFLSGTSHERPFYYYLYQFPVDFLPWTLLWPLVVWAGRHRVFTAGANAERRRGWRFLLAWIGASLVFFSLSAGKRGLYLLPAFPAAALLCGDALALALAERHAVPHWASRVAAVLAGALVLAGLGAGAALVVGDLPVATAPAAGFAAAVVASAVTAALAWRALQRRGATPAAYAACAVGVVFAVEAASFFLLYPAMDPEKSPRPVALAAAAHTPPDQPIGLVGDRPKLPGFAYYGLRRIVHLDTSDDVRDFLADGGRTLLVRRHKLERIEAVTPVEIHAAEREGRRQFVVVSPRAGVAAPPPGGP